MSTDPFERFERSRGGLLIPVLLFFLGAVPTALAVHAMAPLTMIEEEAEVPGGNGDALQPDEETSDVDEGAADSGDPAPTANDDSSEGEEDSAP